METKKLSYSERGELRIEYKNLWGCAETHDYKKEYKQAIEIYIKTLDKLLNFWKLLKNDDIENERIYLKRNIIIIFDRVDILKKYIKEPEKYELDLHLNTINRNYNNAYNGIENNDYNRALSLFSEVISLGNQIKDQLNENTKLQDEINNKIKDSLKHTQKLKKYIEYEEHVNNFFRGLNLHYTNEITKKNK